MCDFCGTIKICTNPVLKLHNLRVLLTTNTKNTQLTDGEGNIIQSKMFLPLIMAHTSLLYNYQKRCHHEGGEEEKKVCPNRAPKHDAEIRQSSVVVPNQNLHNYARCL